MLEECKDEDYPREYFQNTDRHDLKLLWSSNAKLGVDQTDENWCSPFYDNQEAGGIELIQWRFGIRCCDEDIGDHHC